MGETRCDAVRTFEGKTNLCRESVRSVGGSCTRVATSGLLWDRERLRPGMVREAGVLHAHVGPEPVWALRASRMTWWQVLLSLSCCDQVRLMAA